MGGRQRNKKKFRLSKILLILAIMAGLVYWQYNNFIYNPVDKSDTSNVSFQIKKGENAKIIAEKLEEKGLIKSKTAFYIHVRHNELGEKLLAGRFVLNKSMNVPEIIETFTDPTLVESVITIQEGLRIRDIDEKLVKLGLIEKDEFISEVKEFKGWEYYDFLDQATLSKLDLPLEGYLYPDTYFLNSEEFEAQDLIYIALDNFENKFKEIEDRIDKKSIHKIITMASIIENEVFGEEDRRIISGILWKRLESGWTIGADATLLYITEGRTITAKDLEIESAYNTRKNLGLPPGPISNPSISSIKAAINPKESEYWFYLTTLDTGEVIYARSNEEHNSNKAKYL